MAGASVGSISGERADVEIQQPEKELVNFLQSMPVALHWSGPDGTIIWANEAELLLLGYAREEYVGRNVAEFHVDEHIARDILDHLGRNEELHDYESRLRCKDGSIKYVAITSNVYRRDGRFIHTRFFTREIAEKKRAEELQLRLAAIVESSDDAIVSKDLNGIIRSWNRAAERLFGYTAEEVIGRHISMLAAPDRIDEIPNILHRIAQGERVDHYETKRRTKDGRIITVSLTISPIKDTSGTIVGASKIARDITERDDANQALREANAALARANADLEQFAFSVTHDLQEPIRNVALYAQMFQRSYGDGLDDRGKQFLNYIYNGARQIESLVRDLLAFTHLSAIGPSFSDSADVQIVFDDVINGFIERIRENKASVTYDRLPLLRIQPVHLRQLLSNLLSNALKYRAADPPRVHLSAKRQGSQWLLSFADNGIGIEEKYANHIFGLFRRLHTREQYPGTGIGLAICQKIVERYGGQIWVESSVGNGATFHFTLPGA